MKAKYNKEAYRIKKNYNISWTLSDIAKQLSALDIDVELTDQDAIDDIPLV